MSTAPLKTQKAAAAGSLLAFDSEKNPILRGAECGDMKIGDSRAFSPATCAAGNTTYCTWKAYHNDITRIEQMFLCFTVTNTSGTDTVSFVNPWMFLSRFNVYVECANAKLQIWDNDLTNIDVSRIVGRELQKQDIERLDEQAVEFKEATALSTAITIAPGASYNFRLNLFYLLPQFRDFTLNAPGAPKFNSLEFKLTMPASTGTTVDNQIVRNATADANILSKLTQYTNMNIYTVETVVRDARLLQNLPTMFMFPDDVTQTRSVDFGTQYNTYTFTLSDVLPPGRYWGVSFLVWYPTAAYNDANAQKFYGNEDVLTFSYQRVGAPSTLVDLTGAANSHKRKQYWCWQREQRNGRKLPAGTFGDVPLFQYYKMGLTLDLRLIERDAKDTLVSWIDVKKGLDRDYSITLQCLSALSASSTLMIIAHKFNPLTIDGNSVIVKSPALIGL